MNRPVNLIKQLFVRKRQADISEINHGLLLFQNLRDYRKIKYRCQWINKREGDSKEPLQRSSLFRSAEWCRRVSVAESLIIHYAPIIPAANSCFILLFMIRPPYLCGEIIEHKQESA
jgi:hypothetical protein